MIVKYVRWSCKGNYYKMRVNFRSDEHINYSFSLKLDPLGILPPRLYWKHIMYEYFPKVDVASLKKLAVTHLCNR